MEPNVEPTLSVPAATVAINAPQAVDFIHRLRFVAEDVSWTRGLCLLLVGIFIGVAGGKLVHVILTIISDRIKRKNWRIAEHAVSSLAGPAGLVIFAMGLGIGLMQLPNMSAFIPFVGRGMILAIIIAVGWFLYRMIDLVDELLHKVTAHTETTVDDMILPLIQKTLRIFLGVVLVLFTAQNVFGADITAWLAGLGIAGLAVSLAAQDSLKNLFGSLTVFLDNPFKMGDRILFDGHDGPVEYIGFRSTKIRTLTGDLVTVPNARIVDGSVKNISRRPHIRRTMDISVTYDTSPEKMRQAVEIVRGILDEPEIKQFFDMEKNPPRAAFEELKADNLNIKVFYWYTPPEYWGYLAHAEKINLMLLDRFAAAGIEFAFPTQTVHIVKDLPEDPSVQG